MGSKITSCIDSNPREQNYEGEELIRQQVQCQLRIFLMNEDKFEISVIDFDCEREYGEIVRLRGFKN